MENVRISGFVVALVLLASSAQAQTACPVSTGVCGVLVGSTPVAVTKQGPKVYERITNSGAATAWCTRDAAATPGANAASSFPISASGSEEYPIPDSKFVPYNPTRCVSGSTAVLPMTVEVN